MSTHAHVYVGPYLEIKNDPIPTTKKVQTCGSKSCPKHKKEINSNFCPHCGAKTTHIDIPCKGEKEFNVYTEFNEKLAEVNTPCRSVKDGYLILIPNVGKLGKQMDGDCETEVLSYIGFTVDEQMKKFGEEFVNEIARCMSVFGSPLVTIKWGVLVYQY